MLAGVSGWAATLSVSPSTIDSRYRGMLTLRIGEVPSGARVQVERYLDLNDNGLVDTADLLTLQFNVTDGQVALIGGATNLNVPGDLDPMAGALTTRLNYCALSLDQVVGRHLWRVVSPDGWFASVTHMLTVNQAALDQGVGGTVRSDGAPVPRAVVVALDMAAEGSLAGATLADAAGSYQLKLPPGSYGVLAAKPGYLTDFGSVPMIDLGPGQTLTANLSLMAATRTISGKLVDAADSSRTLKAVFLQVNSAEGQFAPAWTDAAGNFTAAVGPGEWQIEPAGEDLARLGYLFGAAEANRTFLTTTGNVAGVELRARRANALVYGRALDQTNGPLAGVRLSARGSFQGEEFYGHDPVTDADGNYAAAILGGQMPSETWWNLTADPVLNPSLTNYVMAGFRFGLQVLAGQALRQDLRALWATNRIAGQVRAWGGGPVAWIGVFGWADLGGTTYYGSGRLTDAEGRYVMAVAGSPWQVQLHCHDLMDAGFNCAPAKTALLGSGPAVLDFTVFPLDRPGLSDPSRQPDGSFRFNLHGEPFVDYRVQYSTNLIHWTDLLTIRPQMGGYNYVNNVVTDHSGSSPRRFYRVLRW